MDDDLKKGLLSKKGSGFDKMYEDCVVRIQRVKQKNDVIQKQIGTEIEESIRTEVNIQRKYLEKEINELKNLMTQMDNKYRDPESKNKLKQLKLDAQKQIQRNKIILKDLINKSFAQRSFGRAHEEDHSDRLMEGGRISYEDLDHKGSNHEENLKASLLTDNIEIDYELERKMLLQKNEMINDVEQSTIRINEIMNDMGVMVDEQGEMLDVISDELMKTNQNMISTNQNLEQASTLQKKSSGKYKCLIGIIILALIIVGGVLFILLF